MSEMSGKWGRTVAQRGFAQVPNYLMLINRFLGEESRLSPTELLVLIQLVGTWWKKEEKPFPSMRTLAVRCGVSERQMQRAINSLVSKGLLIREKRRTKGIIASNIYDMQPLVDVLGEIARVFPNEYPRRDSKLSLSKLTSKDEDEDD
jgi:predicted transcriptional regulator